MNIGNIVSTVQAEPLNFITIEIEEPEKKVYTIPALTDEALSKYRPLDEEFMTQEKAKQIITSTRKTLDRYEMLVNEEITPEIKEDMFSGVS